MAFILRDGFIHQELRDRISVGLPTYIVGPASTEDPEKPGHLLRDTGDRSIAAEALLRTL